MILVIDNYDSFTFNLVHYLQELGAEVRVERNDALTAREAVGSGAKGILLSPGPRTPNEAGITLDTVAACADAQLPLLGVCLGHQAIGQHFGGRVVQGGLMHGKTSAGTHDGSGIFASLPSPFNATRYHSLVVYQDSLPDCLEVTAWTDRGLIMGLRHKEYPVEGVQFHPESIASQHGHKLLGNFLDGLGGQSRAA